MKFALVLLLTLLSVPAFAADNIYERVVKAGTIRCGYVQFPPNMMKDATTGKMSGISYELFNKMGEAMGLKVEWIEEVGFGELVSSMETGRVDAICTTVGVNAMRGVRADFVEAPYYIPTGLWVRADDKRFDKNTDLLNAPEIKIASLEGTVFDAYIKAYFPKAQIYSLPQLSGLSEQMVAVETSKADATLLDNYIGGQYAEAHPGKMKNLMIKGENFRVDPVAFMILKGQEDFKSMLNVAQNEQILTGTLDKIIASYKLPPNSVYTRTLPYQQ